MKTQVLTKISALAFAAAILFPACNRVDSSLNETKIPIAIDTDIAQSRTHTRVNTFQTDDQIGLFVVAYPLPDTQGTLLGDGNFLDNVRFTRINSSPWWSVVKDVYYPPVDVDVYAYSPYNSAFKCETATSEYVFTVSEDQTTGAKVRENDFMSAQTIKRKAIDGAVPLTFHHRLSRVQVIIDLPHSFQNDEIVSVNSIHVLHAATEAVIDLSSPYTFTVNDNSNMPKPAVAKLLSKRGNIETALYKNEGRNYIYEAIVVPQTFAKDEQMIQIELGLDGGETVTYNYVVKEEDGITCLPSQATIMTLTFNDDKELSLGSVTITGWDEVSHTGDIVESEVYNKFEVALSSVPAADIYEVQVTVAQGNNPSAQTERIYTVDASNDGSTAHFSFDAINPGPEFYPFTIKSTRFMVTGQSSIPLEHDVQVTKTGTVALAQ